MVDANTPCVLWLGASYSRICRDWTPKSPVHIIPEIEMSLEAYRLHENIVVLDEQAIYPSDPDDTDKWEVVLDPSQEGLEKIQHLSHSGDVSHVVIEGCLASGILKAPMISEPLRSSALVILLNNSNQEQLPYRELGFKHFSQRGDMKGVTDSLKALNNRAL